MHNGLFSSYSENLTSLKNNFQLREVSNIIQDGKYIKLGNSKLLNLSSNDYLGISANYDIKDNFLASYKGKIQNPSARLLCGTNSVFLELEELVSKITKRKRALLFNSGYHANVGIYSSLAGREDIIFTDKLNHASIIDGIKLSGAKLVPFSHCDYFDLEEKLKKYRKTGKISIISSETLFSMDGDFADIEKLIRLKEKYNSILILDEAHSFGVYNNGGGISTGMDGVDLIMGTFGKAIGSYGAFAAGESVLIDYLINHARSFIFSTALPEIAVSFSKYVLENYIQNGYLQNKLFSLTDFAHKQMSNFNILGSSYILPLVFGENSSAVNISNKLIENGFYILPIRYPTVKRGQARIRISLNPLIENKEIEKLCSVISQAFMRP